MKEGKANLELEKNLEDTVGVSFRAFRTIRDLFIRPNVVFRAYEEGNTTKYTPALKVWFTLFSLYFTAVYFLGGLNKALLARSGNDLIKVFGDNGLSPESSATVVTYFEDVYALIAFPLTTAFMLLTIWVLKRFNRDLNIVARVNTVFAILIPAYTFSLLVFIPLLMTSYPINWEPLMPLYWLMYFLTFYRGTRHWYSSAFPEAFLKSLLFTIVLGILELIGSGGAAFVSMLVSGIKHSHLL
jgi:hypothetical protein